jgi:hypothetical protein
MFIFLLISTSQAIFLSEPIAQCSDQSPRDCLTHCLCEFCTENQTLANGLLDGTITPIVFHDNKNTSQEYCINANNMCPTNYYTVPGANIIAQYNTNKCKTNLRILVIASIVAGIVLIGCSCCIVIMSIQECRKKQDSLYSYDYQSANFEL